MIKSVRHKGLKKLFENDDASGVNTEHAAKLRNILATLNAAPSIAHMGRVKGILGRHRGNQHGARYSAARP